MRTRIFAPAPKKYALPAITVVIRERRVSVGEESIRFLDGLSTRVDDGATIMIVPAVSGG